MTTPRGPHELDWDEVLRRLAERLDPASFALVEAHADACDADTSVLWLDAPWAEVGYDAMATSRALALAVFDAPLEHDAPLVLGAEPLAGAPSALASVCFVFLDDVRVEALTTLPDTLAVFAGGLEVTTVACLAAPDAITHVADHLRAAYLVCGHGEGALDLAPDTETRIGRLSGAFGGLRTASEALPFLAEIIEDDGPAAALSSLQHLHQKVPDGFVWPGGWRPPRFPLEWKDPEVEVVDADAYRAWRDGPRMSVEARELLRGMDDELLEDEGGARFVECLPTTAELRRLRERIVVVTRRVEQEGAIELVGRGDDGWVAYVFTHPVTCGDVYADDNVLAIFRDTLTARAVAPRATDCHLLAESLRASILCETVYVRRRTSIAVGLLAGTIARPVSPAEALVEWADELAAGEAPYRLLADAFADDATLEAEGDAFVIVPLEREEDEAPEPEGPSCRFAIDAEEALARLRAAKLPRASLEPIARFAERHGGDGAVLWIDEPWAGLGYDDMAVGDPVALAVFTEPLVCDGPLSLSAEQLTGDGAMRDERAFVFLGEVRAEALTTLPDTLAIFAGGLEVETAACLSAADATTQVHRSLRAPCVLGAVGGDGGVRAVGRVRLTVDVLVGAIEGAKPRARGARIEEAYARWAEALEDGTPPWELFLEAFDEDEPVGPD